MMRLTWSAINFNDATLAANLARGVRQAAAAAAAELTSTRRFN
jgi:hypothetical protein